MIRDKWIIGFRNRLANLAMECDSCAAIEGSRLSELERNYLHRRLRDCVNYIDENLPKPKK